MSYIVICDDDEEFSGMIGTFIKSLGHEVCAVSSPTQLGSALLQRRPDLLVTDVEMPGGGGASAAKLLMNMGAADLPVVVCSGLAVEKQRPVFAGLKKVRHFQKPVDLDGLEAALRDNLARR